MTSDTRPPGSARLGHGLLTTALVLAVVAPIAIVLMLLAPGGGKTTITVNVPSSAVRALPDGAELASSVPVKVDLSDPSAKQVLGILLGGAIPYAVAIFVLNELRKIVGTVRRGDPFITENVRRLRWIGYALIIGGPLIQIVPQFFAQAVAESAGMNSSFTHYDIPPTLTFVGIGVLVLAHVFAHGVRLREDVEGTV
jgi:hypothetical protein